MLHVEIKILEKDAAPAWPEIAGAVKVHGNVDKAGILEGGMVSGKTSVMLIGKNAEGEYAALEISADLFETLAGAVRGARARFGS